MSGYAISDTSGLYDETVPASESKQGKSPADTAKLTDKAVKANSEPTKAPEKLPAVYKEKNVAVVGASQLLAENYPASYSPENYQKAINELKLVLKGIAGFVFLVYIGWTAARQHTSTVGGDLIYNAGLVGGSLMLVALIYAIIKRAWGLRRFLASDVLYYVHIACGAVGAYLVILHTSFDLRSINGSVALAMTLIVIISGALGRYLYTLSTISLHRQYVDIRNTENNLFELIEKYDCDHSDRIRQRLSKFAQHCFKKPESFFSYSIRWMSVFYFGIYYYLLSKRDLRKISKVMSKTVKLEKKDFVILKKYQKKQLRYYLWDTVVMGYTSLVEQVLRHWRILHIPALYILTTTAIVHVVVIHMY